MCLRLRARPITVDPQISFLVFVQLACCLIDKYPIPAFYLFCIKNELYTFFVFFIVTNCSKNEYLKLTRNVLVLFYFQFIYYQILTLIKKNTYLFSSACCMGLAAGPLGPSPARFHLGTACCCLGAAMYAAPPVVNNFNIVKKSES